MAANPMGKDRLSQQTWVSRGRKQSVSAPVGVGQNLSRTDVQLMALIAAGDESALGELYDRHGGIAYGLALRVCRDAGLAEEAVQDGFLSVWRSAARFDSARGAPRSWLLTLVHRRAVDLVQRASRRQEQPSAWLAEGAGPSAASIAEVNGERRRVREALDGLPLLQRQALELAYYGGLSQSQIAEHLGVPVGTIKSRMYAALAALRDALSKRSDQDRTDLTRTAEQCVRSAR